ncbi:MAG: glycosyltransferase [Magnetococcus sp. DMHC-6]
MNKYHKIAVFLPSDTPFYRALWLQIKRGFEKKGIHIVGGTTLLPEKDLLTFCHQHLPNAILEMNRTRFDLPYLPSHIQHIAWIVDRKGREDHEFSNSDILYYFCDDLIDTASIQGTQIIDWLPPGFCPQTYFLHKQPQIVDFSFVGHIPFPWNPDELNRSIIQSNGLSLSFAQLIEAYEKLLQENDLSNFVNTDYINLAQKIIKNHTGIEVNLDNVLRYDLGCRALRMRNRHRLIRLALENTQGSLRIHGTGGWEAWPQYRSFFHGPIFDPAQLCALFQKSRINLHVGTDIHFRSLDCLASGGFLFYLKSPDNKTIGRIESILEPDRHYIPVTEEDFSDKAKFYLSHDEKRQQISTAASQTIHANHTWSHRADTILKDLNKLSS